MGNGEKKVPKSKKVKKISCVYVLRTQKYKVILGQLSRQ